MREECAQSFKDKLQIVYGEMLREYNIPTGDISPLQLMAIEQGEDILADAVAKWIISSKEVL